MLDSSAFGLLYAFLSSQRAQQWKRKKNAELMKFFFRFAMCLPLLACYAWTSPRLSCWSFFSLVYFFSLDVHFLAALRCSRETSKYTFFSAAWSQSSVSFWLDSHNVCELIARRQSGTRMSSDSSQIARVFVDRINFLTACWCWWNMKLCKNSMLSLFRSSFTELLRTQTE